LELTAPSVHAFCFAAGIEDPGPRGEKSCPSARSSTVALGVQIYDGESLFMNMKRILETSRNTSQVFYLQLISIISSLSLGFLLVKANGDYLFGNEFSVLYWLKITATIQIIILTWHEYVMGTIYFRWVVGYIDSAIPFMFAITQYIVIQNIHPGRYHKWFLALGAFAIVSILAYMNQYIKAKKEKTNRYIIRRLKVFHYFAMSYSLFAVIGFCLASWLTYRYSNVTINYILLIACNTTFVAFGMLVYALRKRQNK
jgi:hypothetical protein